jgi:Holliday junction resolvase-like predicted endonuclease
MARTDRQVAGDAAEALVAERLAARGWVVLGTNVRFGRCELDIVATDPGPPGRLVVFEVRWRASRAFGGAEESFDYKKRGQLRLGVGRLVEAGQLPDGTVLPRMPIAVDLAVVEPGSGASGGRPVVKLYRNALGE